jgi:predicted HD superfamily hydrolase involved in NAD metabolism
MPSPSSKKLTDIAQWVKCQVSPRRFSHIQGVVLTAKKLAAGNGLGVEKAALAAWLHDCAKEWPKSKMLASLKQSPFHLDALEKEIPALWHPHAGAAAAYGEWKIRDPDILQAVRCHTLGNPLMGPLAQVLFVADFIEPGRRFKDVARIRRVARSDLREGVLNKASLTMDFLFQKRMKIHPRLVETWNSFLKRETP